MALEMVLAYLLVFCRITVGFAFLVSSISKAANLKQFRQAIVTFGILPQQYTNITALLFVGMECIVALFMILGNIFLIPGFFLSIVLLSLFSLALLSVLVRKMIVSCNCFGPGDKPVTGFDVIRNGGFIVCALTGNWLLFEKQNSYSLSIPEWAMVGLSATVFVLIWIKLDDIMRILSSED